MDSSKIQTPESLQPHQHEYRSQAWKAYTLQELGFVVHFFAKRAEHRADPEKRRKDLYDARNYWRMMGAYLDALEAETPALTKPE